MLNFDEYISTTEEGDIRCNSPKNNEIIPYIVIAANSTPAQSKAMDRAAKELVLKKLISASFAEVIRKAVKD